MASNDDDYSFSSPLSDEELGYSVVRPGETREFPAGSSREYSEFRIHVTTTYTRRWQTAAPTEELDDVELLQRLRLTLPFAVPLLAVTQLPLASRTAVADFLGAGRVRPPWLGAAALADEIVACFRRMAIGVPPRGRVLRVSLDVEVFVDELPDTDELIEDYLAADIVEIDEEELLGFADGDGADDLYEKARFVAASEEAIAGLERVRVDGFSEKECAVCLEHIPLGSEVTRLPCSHHFHGDCIVKWLNISKFCPLSRFEFPS